jgi:hypothetical protein
MSCAIKSGHFNVLPTLAIYNHEICNQLASYSECCTVGIPVLPCVLIYQNQIGIPSGRQLRRFDEHPLDMFVSLLRNCLIDVLSRDADERQNPSFARWRGAPICSSSATLTTCGNARNARIVQFSDSAANDSDSDDATQHSISNDRCLYAAGPVGSVISRRTNSAWRDVLVFA